DGGGIRGLSSLLILQELMNDLQDRQGLPGPPLPCEIFDLICGTSTGGLIAIMLGRLRMRVEDAISIYVNFSKEVFGSPVAYSWLQRGLGKAKYSASNLEKRIKKIVSDREGDETAPLRDPLGDKCCRVFVIAVSKAFANAPPRIFRSYRTKSKRADSCAIWEAARATTAATTFFDPIQMGSPPESFIDGGFSGANNPSKQAKSEIREIFPKRRIGCFLSLGTGVGDIIPISNNYVGIAQACVKLITVCELVAHDIAKEFEKETREGKHENNPYFRFSAEEGLENIKLDDWEYLDTLTGVTRAYLRHDERASMV
ncbi:FabD/lysophospholipase-like protein, partial [Ramaria rubella]